MNSNRDLRVYRVGTHVIETHVIALHSDVGVDVKSDRIELFDSFFLWGSENCNRGNSENK